MRGLMRNAGSESGRGVVFANVYLLTPTVVV